MIHSTTDPVEEDTERDPELFDRTSPGDVRLIKIIHGLVLDLRHEENETKREN